MRAQTVACGRQPAPEEVNGMAYSEEKAKEIIAKELEVSMDQLTPDAKFIEDLGADSLDTVELVMALEEEFGLDIHDEDADKFKTVGDALSYLKEHATN
jgi:acyl carrier protein